jgi:hypothetical protein
MPTSDEEARELKVALMRADLELKSKQAFWETPRNIAVLVATVAALAGVLGFKLGQNAPQPQIVVLQPGTTQAAQPTPPLR